MEILSSPTFPFPVPHTNTFQGISVKVFFKEEMEAITLDYLVSPPSQHKRFHYQHLSTSAHPCSPPLMSSSRSLSQTAQPRLDSNKNSQSRLNQWPLFSSPRAAVTSALPFPGSIAFDSCAVESAGGEWVGGGSTRYLSLAGNGSFVEKDVLFEPPFR